MFQSAWKTLATVMHYQYKCQPTKITTIELAPPCALPNAVVTVTIPAPRRKASEGGGNVGAGSSRTKDIVYQQHNIQQAAAAAAERSREKNIIPAAQQSREVTAQNERQ
jgi:hypothetical protein